MVTDLSQWLQTLGSSRLRQEVRWGSKQKATANRSALSQCGETAMSISLQTGKEVKKKIACICKFSLSQNSENKTNTNIYSVKSEEYTFWGKYASTYWTVIFLCQSHLFSHKLDSDASRWALQVSGPWHRGSDMRNRAVAPERHTYGVYRWGTRRGADVTSATDRKRAAAGLSPRDAAAWPGPRGSCCAQTLSLKSYVSALSRAAAPHSVGCSDGWEQVLCENMMKSWIIHDPQPLVINRNRLSWACCVYGPCFIILPYSANVCQKAGWSC